MERIHASYLSLFFRPYRGRSAILLLATPHSTYSVRPDPWPLAARSRRLSLRGWFMPYCRDLRCGGHTGGMFISADWLRGIYFATLVNKSPGP